MANFLRTEKILSLIETSCNFFTEYGFHNTGVNTIANQSDVSKMTLYKYFPKKEKLISTCLIFKSEKLKVQVMSTAHISVDISVIDQLKQIFFLHADIKSDYYLIYKGIFELKSDYPEAYKIISEYRTWLIQEMYKLIRSYNPIASPQDANMFLFIIDGALTQLLSKLEVDQREALFDYFLSMICTPLQAC
ncbi:TetR/AcrR family transcriptional regulator (plasmid) [Acinetobacter baumannii]